MRQLCPFYPIHMKCIQPADCWVQSLVFAKTPIILLAHDGEEAQLSGSQVLKMITTGSDFINYR